MIYGVLLSHDFDPKAGPTMSERWNARESRDAYGQPILVATKDRSEDIGAAAGFGILAIVLLVIALPIGVLVFLFRED